MTKQKKRFIAGATCPQCQATDTVMLFKENNVEKIECVNCGHTTTQPEQSVNAATRQFEQIIGVFNPDKD